MTPPPAAAPSASPLVVIVGPTAAGKSRLALDLCARLGAELVSADSVQVYRGLDIGSAKPTPAERERVRHHAIDRLDPSERSDAGRWLEIAEDALRDIARRGLPAVVCGGTGLYVKALLYGLAPVPPIDGGVRDALERELAARGPEALHAELGRVDPAAAGRVAPRDAQRVTRALAVFRQTGRPLSAWQRDHGFTAPRREATVAALWPERDALRAAIDERALAMVAAGLLDEVRALLAAGVPHDAPGLQTLGYREAVAVARGEAPLDALAERVAAGHRRYAKRQLTWFRPMVARGEATHLDPRHAATPDALLRLARG